MFAHPRPTLTCLIPILLLLASIAAASSPGRAQAADPAALIDTDSAVRALCGERVALLGEPPIHGFGNTLAFKAQLVRRLVQQCHYNAVFFESGLYDFLHIDQERRSGHDVPTSMISNAIGGLWANKEVQSLVPFLRDEVNAGRLTLAGLDDQIGAGSYASRQMSSDLVQSLAGEEQSRCLAILERHMLWRYTQDAPYRISDKERIVGCLDEIKTQLSRTQQQTQSSQQSRAMVESLERNFTRNFTEDDFTNKDQEIRWFNDRDRSMYVNFEWLLHRLPPRSKIIVWAATVHTAKDLSGVAGFEQKIPLRSYIHKAWNHQAFSLAFSAYSGEYAFTHQPVRPLGTTPLSSLEAQGFTQNGSSTVYLSSGQLQGYGSVQARPLSLDFKTAHWDRVVDGLILVRVERAPDWISPR